MPRLTKHDIEQTLLRGDKIEWENANGAVEDIDLGEAAQRRLFDFLRKSQVREAKGLPSAFVEGLASAVEAATDPAAEIGAGEPAATTGPWRLRKIETSNFGGLNLFEGPTFEWNFDGESLILQGPNGSGKSSLVGAIVWAMTGERPRDYGGASANARAPVFDADGTQIGTWPPIASYPTDPAKLESDPVVWVKLTLAHPDGTTAVLERCLESGEAIRRIDDKLKIPDIFVETGLRMPVRMAHIRLEGAQTPLTEAVQALTGLDDLVAIGGLVESLCHKGREYLSTKEKEFKQSRVLFDAALAEAVRALTPTGEGIGSFVPADTADNDGTLAKLGKRLRERAEELTRVVSDDLAADLDFKLASVQADINSTIAVAQDLIVDAYQSLGTRMALVELDRVLDDGVARALLKAAQEAEDESARAAELHARAQADTRFRLKALGAHWHEENRPDTGIENCPLCDSPIADIALRTEIEALRRAAAMAARSFEDNLNSIEKSLRHAIPNELTAKIDDFAALAPEQRLRDELRSRLAGKPKVRAILSTFVNLVEEALATAPAVSVAAAGERSPTPEGTARIESLVADVRRLPRLKAWFAENDPKWQDWWRMVAVGAEPAADHRREALTRHLTRLAAAVGQAEPYRNAAEALGRAWRHGKAAHLAEIEQKKRETVAGHLTPLKSLGRLAQAQARSAIGALSAEIAATLKRMHVSERLTFQGADLQKKAGLVVHAGFDPSMKIDATLVANTAWIRAVLWAFVFALRKEAVDRHGGDPLPLLVFDDPQATFDPDHRHRWTLEIAALQEAEPGAQVLIASHDDAFIELAKISGIKARDARIAAWIPGLERAGIFEGAMIDRLWKETKSLRTKDAALKYIAEVRCYVESVLRLMLLGSAAGVALPASGIVMGESRTRIDELHKKKLPPWDKPEFKALVGALDRGTPAIKFLEIAHHASKSTLGMAEAEDVEKHWRDKLNSALHRAFVLNREHYALHGGMRALHAPEPRQNLPESYGDKLRERRLFVVGRAAALTDGRVADGNLTLELGGVGSSAIVLATHAAYRIVAPTLEPVARPGDILLVNLHKEPSERSLVVARFDDRIVARRFEVADNHSDLAVFTAKAINPRRIAAPIVVKRATIEINKVVGVLFSSDAASAPAGAEICDCGGEATIHAVTASVKGVVEVSGASAEPYALDGQMLLIGEPVDPTTALKNFDGKLVIAGDTSGARYFKRWRSDGRGVVLESLEIGGEFGPVVSTIDAGAETDITKVWPVLGVLFERP